MVENLLLTMSLGMTQFGMTGEEVWRAVTCGAASAVHREDRGRLVPGMLADIAIFDCPNGLHVPYRMGSMRAQTVYKRGQQAYHA